MWMGICIGRVFGTRIGTGLAMMAWYPALPLAPWSFGKPAQNRTFRDYTGLADMVEVEFQDRCLKPLGHPSPGIGAGMSKAVAKTGACRRPATAQGSPAL